MISKLEYIEYSHENFVSFHHWYIVRIINIEDSYNFSYVINDILFYIIFSKLAFENFIINFSSLNIGFTYLFIC